MESSYSSVDNISSSFTRNGAFGYFHIDNTHPNFYLLSRQIYGGIGLGVVAVAVISMFALSNVSGVFGNPELHS